MPDMFQALEAYSFDITKFVDFVHCPVLSKNTTFLKLELLLSSGEKWGSTYSVGSSRKS
jgi:hypothetical protein